MNTKELTLKIESLEATIAVLIARCEASDAKVQALETWADDFTTWVQNELADVRANATATRVAVAAKSTTSSRIRILAPKTEYLAVKAEYLAAGRKLTTQEVVTEAIKRAKAAKPTDAQ